MWIRVAAVGDAGDISGMSGALFREDAGSRDPSVNLDWPEEEGHEYFSALVSDEDCLCLLAESEEDVIGYLAGRMKPGDSLRPVRLAVLESMYVREDHRSLGVGAKLADEFFRWAESKGAERASVTTYAENERAIRFYGNFGFQPRRVSLEKSLVRSGDPNR
ncbi:MAG: GNAT family N-acetyltransferase [Rubrobacteraceae bacterium]